MIPTYEQVEKSALALMNTERARWNMPPLKDMRTVDDYVAQQYRDLGRAVLAAVGPLIAAQAWEEASQHMREYIGRDASTPYMQGWNQALEYVSRKIRKEAGR